MGWLRNIERGIRHRIRDIARDPIGGLVGELNPERMIGNVDIAAGNYRPISNEGAPEDPQARQKLILKQLGAGAKKFRERLPEFKKEQERAILPTYSQAMEEGTRRTKENYSRRGLLRSGVARKGETELRGELSKQLAEAKTDISQKSEQMASQREAAAAQIELGTASQLLTSAENLYNLQQQNMLARRQAMGSLAQGMGYAVGAGYAGAFSQPKTYNSAYSNPQSGLLGVNYNPNLYRDYSGYA